MYEIDGLLRGGQIVSGVIDYANFEQVKRQGDAAIRRWIDKQLEGTSVTVVLIGADTLNRPYVQYEICESLKRRNPIIGVDIHRIKDFNNRTTTLCSHHTIIGQYENGSPAYFDDIASGIYDYINDDGYNNFGRWVEKVIN